MKALLSAVLVAASINLFAAEPAKPVAAAAVIRNFEAGEIQADVFGALSNPLDAAPKWGVGFGGSYFVTEGLGFGARAISYSDWSGAAIDELEARILYRIPIKERWAPYAFVSGGYSFDMECAGAGAGAGLEYRLTKKLGLFGETGIRVWPSCETTSYSSTGGECSTRVKTTSSDAACDWLTTFGIRYIF